ncbi:dephospho-CoA kinase [Butyrivibrio sp. ob235]|uniref:dephospho-CoA kinase n=1 Tax=unclassified Butyrivibrio TaxID=2639466 RepID=UPI0003B420D4|nr:MULTISPECIES: dephospho-CoA kinase [unclassified Butyrivibrio]SEK41068.1 dephospho-CoA kinase [Butyrivibrio sp. ob235]
MKVIGVTGGVGAGKSTVLNYIEKSCNCRIIFSDKVANDIKLKGQSCYEPIVDLLSEDILGPDGEIDKKKMAAKIFADDSLLKQVNDILHPAVNNYIFGEIEKEKAEGKLDYLFIEAALLIENGYHKIVDELWYIYADESVRRKRLKESRGYSDEKIDDIIKGQLSDEEFRKYASFVIDNSNDENDTKRQIDLKLGEN